MVVCAGSLTITFDPMSGQGSYLNLRKFSWTLSWHADTIKLQSEIPNSAAEQTCKGVYMASKMDCVCVGNEVGVAA